MYVTLYLEADTDYHNVTEHGLSYSAWESCLLFRSIPSHTSSVAPVTNTVKSVHVGSPSHEKFDISAICLQGMLTKTGGIRTTDRRKRIDNQRMGVSVADTFALGDWWAFESLWIEFDAGECESWCTDDHMANVCRPTIQFEASG
eukprot:Gb_37237 [translate_table: standard]